MALHCWLHLLKVYKSISMSVPLTANNSTLNSINLKVHVMIMSNRRSYDEFPSIMIKRCMFKI